MFKLLCKALAYTVIASILLLISFVLYVYQIDTNFEFEKSPWQSWDVRIPLSTSEKLKVAFIVIGTQGDYQPFTLIANEFKKNGNDVIITARDRYRSIIEDAGFKENEVLWVADKEGLPTIEILGNTQRQASVIQQAINGYQFLMRECERYLQILLQDQRFDHIDMIVIHEGVIPIGYLLSQKTNTPLVTLKFSPILTATNEYSIFFTGENNPSIFNWIPFQAYNFFNVYFLSGFFESFQKVHNLVSIPLHKLSYGKLRFDFPTYFLFSNQIYPEIKRLPKWWKYIGPIFREEDKIPTETERFLKSCENDTIIYIGFGSFSIEEYYGSDKDYTSKVFYNTISKLGFCGIFLNATFNISPDSKENLNPKFHFAKQIPHTLVFPRIDLIIHHGGAGTSQVAAASGTMAISIPIFDEQRIHSRFTKAYGTSLELENSNLSESILETTILEALQVNDIKEKSQRIKSNSLGTKALYEDVIFWLRNHEL